MSSPTLDTLILNAINTIESGANTKRNRAIAVRYFGFDGEGGTSMQEAGSDYSLTRESVRQITNKMAMKLKDSLSIPIELRLAVEKIDSSLPASSEDLESILAGGDILSHNYMIEGILNIAKILGVKTKASQVIKHNKVRFVVGDKHAESAQTIESLAISEISHNGAVSLDHLSKVIEGTPKAVRVAFAKAVMNTIPELKWTDNTESWMFFMGRGRNRLLRRLEQIFSLFEGVHITSLKEAIERNWNKNKGENTKVLSEDVMLKVIESTGDYEILDGGKITSKTHLPTEGLIKDFEFKIYNAILESETGTCREKELEDKLVLKEKDKWNFSVALNYCPLIIRHKRGVYKLVGTPRKSL